jgi:hypothetical protein
MRIQEEYSATIDKLTNPSIRLKNQSITTTRRAFMADPVQFGQHPKFSKEWGMSDSFQMSHVSKTDLIEWQQERMGLYNY